LLPRNECPKGPNELSRSRKPDNLDLEPISAAGRLEIRKWN
jgi:hypothetical protein